MDQKSAIEETAGRLIDLEAELESAGNAMTDQAALDFARARLHEWIDSVVGVVVAAGSGRVTLIHAQGKPSGVASANLAYRLTPPVRFE